MFSYCSKCFSFYIVDELFFVKGCFVCELPDWFHRIFSNICDSFSPIVFLRSIG